MAAHNTQNGAHGDAGKIISLWINGEATSSTPPVMFPVYSIARGKIVHHAQSANSEAAERAVDAAAASFATWKNTSPQLRRDLLFRVAERYEAKTPALVEAQMSETSCTESWAQGNIKYSIECIRESASRVTSISGDIPQTQSRDRLALVFKQPIGPILTIAPWNGAIILATRAITNPIAVGCTVVFKASELCPQTHHLIREAWEEAGLPKGVLNVIQTAREDAPATTETLIANPKVRKVEFIGSRAVGAVIGQLCAKYIKPVILELGGKSPVIVLDDANLREAAEWALVNLSLHHGQICFSAERLLVQESIAEEFTRLLVELAPSHSPGLPVTVRMAENANSKVTDAESKGAKVITGGSRYDSSSISGLKLTILTGITRDMSIYDEETFGPSASLYTFQDDREAIEMANDTSYGLTAAIHTSNMERGLDLAREIEAAQIHINNLTGYDEPTLPNGGEKGSGWGRGNAAYSMHEYLTIKTITVGMKKSARPVFA